MPAAKTPAAKPTSAALFAGVLIAGSFLFAAPAAAMPESCQKEFGPLMQQRVGYMKTIDGFKKKKATAPQACSTFGGLANVNRKIVTWMEAQKDWCQVPDDMVSNFKEQQGQIDKVRGQACNAAAQQAKMIKQMKNRAAQQQRQQAGGGVGVGGGVRLPQGAL